MASWCEETTTINQFTDEIAADREELKRIAADAISHLQVLENRLFVRTSEMERTLNGVDWDDSSLQLDSLLQQIHEIKGPLCKYMHERTKKKLSDIRDVEQVAAPLLRSVSRTRSDGTTRESMYCFHDNIERLVTIVGCMGNETTDIQYTRSISFLNHSENLKLLPDRSPCGIESIQKGSLLLWKDKEVMVVLPGVTQREPDGSLDREIEILITENVPNSNLSDTSRYFSE